MRIHKKLFPILFVATFLVACNEKEKLENDIVSAEDSGKAEDMYAAVFLSVDKNVRIAERAHVNNLPINLDSLGIDPTSFTDCVDITPTKSSNQSYLSKIVLDFGNGCQELDGRSREGKLIITLDSLYSEQGTSAQVSFDNFKVGGNTIEGAMVITNNGLTGNKQEYGIEITNGKITRSSDGKTIEWNSTRNYGWTGGTSTPTDFSDDEWEISGSSNGVNHEGTSFTLTIDEALKQSYECKWISEGKISIASANQDKRIIDFGDGTCDAKASVTYLGISTDLILD